MNHYHVVAILSSDEGAKAGSGSRRGGEGHFLPPPAFWRIHKQYSKSPFIWYFHFITIVGRL